MAKKMFFYTGTILRDSSRLYYACADHPDKHEDKPGKCGQCGKDLVRACDRDYGYRRNVFTFMNGCGRNLSKDGNWSFLVNTENDPEDYEDIKRNTVAGGLRRFQYFEPKNQWNIAEYTKENIDKYLGTPLDLQNRFGETSEMYVYTAAVRNTNNELMTYDERGTLPKDEHSGWDFRLIPPAVVPEEIRGAGNCSSKCVAEDLEQVQRWLSGAIAKPVFAVCDCNSFHNSSYLFGLLSLRRALDEYSKKHPDAVEPAVLIVNIDQHQDYRSGKDLANSDGWGGPLLDKFSHGAYLSIGSIGTAASNDDQWQMYAYLKKRNGNPIQLDLSKVAKRQDTQTSEQYGKQTVISLNDFLQYKSEGAKPKDGDRTGLEEKFMNLWTKLESELGNTVHPTQKGSTGSPPQKVVAPAFGYCYVTIDRDCMLYNYTQWGDVKSVFQGADHVRAIVYAIVESLRKRKPPVALAGFDITGLPEAVANIPLTTTAEKNYYGATNGDVDTPCKAWEAYNRRKEQSKHLEPPKSPPMFKGPKPPSFPKPKGPPDKRTEEYDNQMREYEEYQRKRAEKQIELEKWLKSPEGIEYQRQSEEDEGPPPPPPSSQSDQQSVAIPVSTGPPEVPPDIEKPVPYGNTEAYKRSFERYQKQSEEYDKYEKEMAEWEKGEGQKHKKAMEEFKKKKRLYIEAVGPQPSCSGDCPDCRKLLMTNLSKEIEELYKKFNEWIK